MLKMMFYSPDEGSIGEISRQLLERCFKYRDDIHVIYQNQSDGDGDKIKNEIDCDLFLCHFMPNGHIFENPCFVNAKTKVLIQPIDGTCFNESFVNDLNKFDYIITPSEYGKNIMLKNKVKKPIYIIPNYYFKDELNDVNSIHYPLPNNLSKMLKDKVVFYHESTHHSRKGCDFMYEGFVRAFSDTVYHNKVILLSKDSPFHFGTFERNEQIKKNIINLQKQYKNPVQILKLSQNLTFGDLKSLWNRLDVYIGLSKIEGFGIPFLRMAYLQKPIIATKNDYNGYQDFLKEDNSYLVTGKDVPALEEIMGIYNKNKCEWTEPNLNIYISKLNEVLNDYYNHKELLVDKKDLEKYSFEKVKSLYLELISELTKKKLKLE